MKHLSWDEYTRYFLSGFVDDADSDNDPISMFFCFFLAPFLLFSYFVFILSSRLQQGSGAGVDN
jgi:hypothetical protein